MDELRNILNRMLAIPEQGDIEISHVEADQLLIEALVNLVDCSDCSTEEARDIVRQLVDKWKSLDKWYA